MSIQALTWAWEQQPKPAQAKIILLALANFADEDGYCYPGQASLVIMTGQSERSVRNHLRALIAGGLIAAGAPAPDDGRSPRAGYLLQAPPDRLRTQGSRAAPRPANPAGRQQRATAGDDRQELPVVDPPRPANPAGPDPSRPAELAGRDEPRPATFDATTGNFRHPPLETPRVDDPSGSESETHTARAGARDDAFARFWDAYPHPEFDPKAEAHAVWATLWGSIEPELVIAAARRYAEALAGRPRSFPLQARNWLAKARWRDAPAQPQRAAPAKPPDGPAVAGLVEAGLAAQFRAACTELRRTIGAAPFASWIAPLALIAFDGRQATLAAPGKFHGDWVRQHFEAALAAALRAPVTIVVRRRDRAA